MNKYIGVKLVDGELMTLGEYNKSRGWTIPVDEDPNREGYRVVYKSGYVSWCPLEEFKEQNLNYSGKNNKISLDDVDALISYFHVNTLDLPGSASKTTVVQCVLKNGFIITESSACVDPVNYDEKIGAEICIKKIKDKIWFLLGFLLQSAVYGFEHSNSVPKLEKISEEISTNECPEKKLRHVEEALLDMDSDLKEFIKINNAEDIKGVPPEIVFTIQSDPIGEVGINGCQAQEIIEYAKCLIQSFNNRFPCRENSLTITKLEEAVAWQEIRTKNRVKAGVEGFNRVH